jgi:hypothetical protein
MLVRREMPIMPSSANDWEASAMRGFLTAANIIRPENIRRSRLFLVLEFFVVRFVATKKTTSFDEHRVPKRTPWRSRRLLGITTY